VCTLTVSIVWYSVLVPLARVHNGWGHFSYRRERYTGRGQEERGGAYATTVVDRKRDGERVGRESGAGAQAVYIHAFMHSIHTFHSSSYIHTCIHTYRLPTCQVCILPDANLAQRQEQRYKPPTGPGDPSFNSMHIYMYIYIYIYIYIYKK
jgi:hypothetical protein